MATLKLKLTIAFDGTAYQGWQVQKIGLGVQQKVEEALAKLFPSAPRVHGSSRTDTGVHALGLVAHCEVPAAECAMPPAKLLLAITLHQSHVVAAVTESPRIMPTAAAALDWHNDRAGFLLRLDELLEHTPDVATRRALLARLTRTLIPNN